jgi:asparagine synthase (glutamine-hydrolysing)
MCGICGVYNYRKNESVGREQIERMASTIIHRGPDDEGFYLAGPLGLGFRRLSIIDLKSGHQPMTNEDKSVWVVFNGEIYNFLELKKELEEKGYQFRNKSDTEVIVHGYKEWGEDVLDRLNGMFGLAVWDAVKRKLMIARDRMGIKLVYYAIINGTIIFGSEIRPLLASGHLSKDVDTTALNLFLRYRYTPSPLTIVRNVRKLAAGTRLIVENQEVREERWYKYQPVPFSRMPSIEEATEELAQLYRQGLKRQLISDVPLGLLLSGGMDSALLLALMKEHGDGWKTFTVGYGKSFKDDELSDASETAKIFSANNIQVHIDQKEFERTLPKIINSLEEPIASSSIVPMFHVCQRAREEVKVALIGQGPDEMFGGYKRHYGVQYGKYWRTLPGEIQSILKRLLKKSSANEMVQRSLYALGEDNRLMRFQKILSIVTAKEINNLFIDGLNEDGNDSIITYWRDLLPNLTELDELSAFNYLELQSSLPDELLMYADKMSMANSIELRVPYLDHDIVEYILRLNANFKINNGRQKYIHRIAATKFLPKFVLKRKKRGFAVNVVDQWFKESIDSGLDQVLKDGESMIYTYLNRSAVQRMHRQHIEGKVNYHKILFSLVCLEFWLRNNNSVVS